MPRVRNTGKVERQIFFPANEDNTPTKPITIPGKGGEATIPNDVWETVKNKPVIKAWIEDGILEVGGRKAKAAKPKEEAPNETSTSTETEGAESEAEPLPLSLLTTKPDIVDQLEASGMTVESIADAEPGDLTGFNGIGKATAVQMIESARVAVSG